MSFSERKGIKPVRASLQVEAMDNALRASLWNVLYLNLWGTPYFMWSRNGNPGRIAFFTKRLWIEYFKHPLTKLPSNPNQMLSEIETFFFACNWNEIYDFLEVIVSIGLDGKLENDINLVLEKEFAGYRLLNGKFVDVTNPLEIEALEEALHDDQFKSVADHLSRALQLLSDRNNPDFRNSIKESISAVESVACILSENNKATLDDALKTLEQSKKLHPALRKAFSGLYGYTSDAEGIRHAMLEESNLTAADAKFFLLSCTTFINYLKSTARNTE
jgi:AbiJ-like protein